jgi:tetratricopeptide (TPR) repeat protein
MTWLRRNKQQDIVSDDEALQPGQTLKQQYRVIAELGRGGFGTVYLVESSQTGELYAAKVMRSLSQEAQAVFRREALSWLALGHHPNVLKAELVDEYNGRLLILSEFIPKDSRGVNSLADYARNPQRLAKTIGLFVQVCDGMTWAYGRGLIAHRDLKPANILIADGMLAKVTDFGIAISQESDSTFWAKYGAVGTEFYMAPEQHERAWLCDERSDIYSFGLVMQVVLEARDESLPQQTSSAGDDSPISVVVSRCLEWDRSRRFQSFAELRHALVTRAKELGLAIPRSIAVAGEADYWEYNNKAQSLLNLGRPKQALEWFEKVLQKVPDHVHAWYGMGRALVCLGSHKEALVCFDSALEASPDFVEALAAKASALRILGQVQQAQEIMDRAMELAPSDAMVWSFRANICAAAGDSASAMAAYDRAISLDDSYAEAWYNKGTYLDDAGQAEHALTCLDKAVELDPLNSNAWDNRGVVLMNLGKKKEAMASFDRAILANPDNALAHANKACLLTGIFPFRKADFRQAAEHAVLALERDGTSHVAWYAYGRVHDALGHNDEAIRGYMNFLNLAQPQMAAQVEWVRQRLARILG